MSDQAPTNLGDEDVTEHLARRAGRPIGDFERERVVGAVLRATSAGPAPARWPWRRLFLPAAAATIVVLVVAAIAWSPRVPVTAPASGSPKPTPTPTVTQAPAPTAASASPSPFAVDGVLPLEQLQAVIDLSRSDGVERTVVANVSLDRDAIKFMRFPLCPPTSPCPIWVGELPGISPSGLIVEASQAVSDYLATVQPPLVPGPLALRVGRSDLELLGVVDLNPLGTLNVKGDLLWPADESQLSTAEAQPPGIAIAVHGFLDWSGPIPCPGEPAPTPPPDGPFDFCPWAWVTPNAYQPWSGNSVSPPPIGVRVQWEAYAEFVPNLTMPIGGYAPSEGTYLLRLVVDPRPSCAPCRGWQVVGRLDESDVGNAPTPSPSPATSTERILTADELRDLYRSTIKSPVDIVAAVGIDGSVPFATPVCEPNAPCPRPLGVIHELADAVVFDPSTDPYPELTRADLSGPVALRLGPDQSIQFLGHVDATGDSGSTWTVPSAGPATPTIPLGTVLAVSGWLSTVSSTCGPAPEPGPTILPPFSCAVADVLSATSQDPPHVTGWASDPDYLRVQRGAYSTFALVPSGAEPTPQYGTYLVEHVANHNSNCTACDGWLMVGRLEP